DPHDHAAHRRMPPRRRHGRVQPPGDPLEPRARRLSSRPAQHSSGGGTMSIFMLAAALMSQTDGAARTEEMYIPTGSLIPRWETRVPAGERESLSVMRRFADCVV